MKKLEVHIYPNKDSRGKTVTFSVRKAIIYFVLTICAILGFIMFSPVQIVENLSNGNLMDVYHQNSVIKDEIKKIRTVVDTTILKVEETRVVRDSTLKLGGLGFTLENVPEDESPKKNLHAMRSTFRKTLNKLEADSALAAHVPVLHPLKNHHDIKARFEMVFDAFTDQELPHRGVDFLAAEGDTVYAPATSVAANRNYQVLFSAPLDHFLDEMSAEVPIFYDMVNTPWILTLTILAIVLPLIGLIYWGIKMIFGFKTPKWRPGLVLFVLWLVILVVLAVLFALGVVSTEYLSA